LVQITSEDAPRDRMRSAVDRLIAYDLKRRTALLDTLERYLAERRSVIESARALFIHPNTLRQRLGRIEELTGLTLDDDEHRNLGLAARPLRLLGPEHVADQAIAIGVGGHHDRLALLQRSLRAD